MYQKYDLHNDVSGGKYCMKQGLPILFPILSSIITSLTIFQNILRSQTAAGMRHRDHGTTGSVIHKNIRPALTTYFFGLDGEKKLTVDKFSQFQEQLQVR